MKHCAAAAEQHKETEASQTLLLKQCFRQDCVEILVFATMAAMSCKGVAMDMESNQVSCA